jgi:hypothetical protein
VHPLIAGRKRPPGRRSRTPGSNLPSYHPQDSDGIRALEQAQLLNYATLSTPGVHRTIEKLLARIEADVAADPQFVARFSEEASNKLKESSGDRYGYQLLSYKASRLLDELKRMHLAWEPNVPDGDHYLEMHPQIGETIMSTLAVACALDDGLHVVADEAALHDCVVLNEEDKIYDALIGQGEPDDLKMYEADQSMVELLVFQQFDFKELTPDNLVRLRQEGKALDQAGQTNRSSQQPCQVEGCPFAKLARCELAVLDQTSHGRRADGEGRGRLV